MRTQLPWYVRFTRTWGNKPGKGKWYKRQLSKARRRLGRALCWDEDAYHWDAGLSRAESECNWKGW